MPLINGMKMACEPCIRGHRSTKCTHANERLMVPVRKPGRPLSACPHPRDQPCGCGGVTAAIPRKQQCHCGSSTPTAQSSGSQAPTRPLESLILDAPSPTKTTFKVQKSSRTPSSRKQSYDLGNLERMDMSNVNFVPFEQRAQSLTNSSPTGYTATGPPPMYGYATQFASMHPQFGHVPMQPPPPPHNMNGSVPHHNGASGFAAPGVPNGSLDQVVESPLPTPTLSSSSTKMNGSSCCCQPPAASATAEPKEVPRGGSSSAAKQKSHSHTSSVSSGSSETRESVTQTYSSTADEQPIFKRESVSTNGTPISMTPLIPAQALPHNGQPFNPAMYPQYVPQNTVFAYPATYGSFQNPLQPFAWRQGVEANSYMHPQAQIPLPGSLSGSLPYDAPLLTGSLDTIHTCTCGDGCQCIGCAAHPYNMATQDYVRSAWSSMSLEAPANEVYTNGQPASNTNGNRGTQSQTAENVPSPTTHTPTSTNSGNGEEQSLSASDFFFVNYPFTSDGCGGDTQDCPCGDDCQCLGCTIHGQPGICRGEGGSCTCADDCRCIGCSMHKAGVAI